MVARIIKGKDIAGLVRYHEKAKSRILYAQYLNDAKDIDALTRQDLLVTFRAYLALNPGVARPTFHVSLNPDPRDKLTDNVLVAIGREYLAGMGYGEQPYLIYKHEDLAREHIHLVSVNVGLDGKVINSSRERYRSEALRQGLERKYNLVRVGEQRPSLPREPEPVDLVAVEYGQTDTTRAVAAVVKAAAATYQCTCLEAFDALLRCYHVTVEEGREAPNRTRGLFYAVVNEKGEKVSIRLPARKLGSWAGAAALQEKFARDAMLPGAENLTAVLARKVWRVLQGEGGCSLADFQRHLAGQGVTLVNPAGKPMGGRELIYIDTQTKTVRGAAALGSAFVASALAVHFARQ